MPQTQTLHANWTFAGAPQGSLRPPKGAWRPARVPGNVHLDLMATGLLKDPLLLDQEAKAAWVEKQDWWYRCRFTPGAGLRKKARVRLLAEGLDTWCTLWLNGRRLGRTEDMFVEHAFEVGGRLEPGANELLLRFEAPMAVLRRLERIQGYRPAVGEEARVQGRKAAYSFGWDWGPRLPTSGVFLPIRLEALEPLRIADLWVRTLTASPARAKGQLWADVECARAATLPFHARLGSWEHRGVRRFEKGLNRLKVDWELAKPGLWWPRGWGEAALTRAELSLEGAGSATLDCGIRTVALDLKADAAGSSFGFVVNGKAVYAKGANWIPADSFLGRVTPGRVEALVALAREANYTLLRVWGGGVYESEDFYAACDRQGLLVWQDFPFACGEAPEHPAFLKLVDQEARAALRRLRRHPSLALLCGNNECHEARQRGWFRGRESDAWGKAIYHRVLPAACAEAAPGVPYWPGSPFGGADPNSEERGDRHNWLVWGGFKDTDSYLEDRSRFVSEFGFAALPGREALKQALAPDQRWPQSRMLRLHDKVENGGGLERLAFYLTSHLPLSGGLDQLRYLSQVLQARVLRSAIEHWRRLKPHNQGAVVWQHNDCWPVLSWALLDGRDEPKLAWHGVREACDDVLLSWAQPGPKPPRAGVPARRPALLAPLRRPCEVWITLDGPKGVRGSLCVERWNMQGREAVLARRRVTAAANRSVRAWRRTAAGCGITDPTRQFLVASLDFGGGARRSLLFFERPVGLELPLSQVVAGARPGKDRVRVAVRSRSLALACEVQAPVPGRFSDNGFDLLPGETRVLEFIPERPGAIRGPWSVKTLNQAQVLARA